MSLHFVLKKMLQLLHTGMEREREKSIENNFNKLKSFLNWNYQRLERGEIFLLDVIVCHFHPYSTTKANEDT